MNAVSLPPETATPAVKMRRAGALARSIVNRIDQSRRGGEFVHVTELLGDLAIACSLLSSACEDLAKEVESR